MTEFTVLELHFENGSIPALDGLETGDTGEHDDDHETGSPCPAKFLPLLVVLVVAIALARKFLDDGQRDGT
ncbi:hypothetical protein [Halorhabdus rudnickae]|uniref:hypothetical protein n=1 Tax=Halorhabdus rudnickae TaxID=1775544 RepID=UPI0010826092|nr:hypothetical protein [Halorhabdus rudnickae]